MINKILNNYFLFFDDGNKNEINLKKVSVSTLTRQREYDLKSLKYLTEIKISSLI